MDSIQLFMVTGVVVGDTRWRAEMLTSYKVRPTKIQFVAVDEAHVVCLWKILYVLLLIAAKGCEQL